MKCVPDEPNLWNILYIKQVFCFIRLSSNIGQLAFLTPPFLNGFSAEVCEISAHYNSDFL
jgi:hypothetical protein